MNPNTRLFRVTITISVLWLLVTCYANWQNYQNQLSSFSFPAAKVCGSDFVMGAAGPELRPTSPAETKACEDANHEAYAEWQQKKKDDAQASIIPFFLLYTLLPIIALLLIAGFAGRYWRWLKGGPQA